MNNLLEAASICLRRMLSAFALCAMLAGCKTDPYVANHIEILNAEKRALEDQLYALEYDYQRVVAELEETREQMEEMDGETSRRGRDESNGFESDTEDETLDLSPGEVQPGTPYEPQIEIPDLPEPDENEDGEAMQFRESPEPVRVEATRLHPDDPWITHVYIDPRRTGGSDFDQQPGDDGLTVVIQPRNRNDDFVPLAGPVSIVALDYAKREEGEEARLARWDIGAEDVDRLIETNENEQGIYLRLAWSDQKPTSSRLMVAVRYTTPDGRKLEAQRDIYVSLPGQFSQRWTPRSTNGREDAESADGIDVARQPGLNEEASLAPSTTDNTGSGAEVVRTSREQPSTAARAKQPVWQPYR